jgi:predicted phosphoribosyltransferase
VLGLPRGGVVVAAGVAAALGAPLDLLVVAKLRLPGQPELAMGAVAAVAGTVQTVRVESVLAAARVPEEVLARARDAAVATLREREAALRGDRPALALAGRPVVLVDDGVATGGTAMAAARWARQAAATRVVLAVPVAPVEAVRRLREEADDVVVVASPEPFFAVGQWYDDFPQVSDQRVVELLAAAGGG